MRQRSIAKFWYVGLVLLVAVMVLVGCGGQASVDAVDVGSSEVSSSAVLDMSYPDALDVSAQLVLGTMRLEEGEHAVTPGQAEVLLPLWQAIQGGTLQGDSEVNAVFSQIEGRMTSEQ